jgi:hypothetical protein
MNLHCFKSFESLLPNFKSSSFSTTNRRNNKLSAFELVSSISTIVNFLDSTIDDMKGAEYIKQTITKVVSEEIKEIIRQSKNELMNTAEEEQSIEKLEKILQEKEAHIKSLETIVYELQTSYRIEADKVTKFQCSNCETCRTKSHSEPPAVDVVTAPQEKYKKSFFRSIFRSCDEKSKAGKKEEQEDASTLSIQLENEGN